jgi:hypothetical protein
MTDREIVLRNLSAFRSACREAIRRAISQGSTGCNPVLFAVKWDDIEEKFRIAVLSPDANPNDYIAGFASEDYRAFRSNGIENSIDEAVYACTIEY